MVDPEDFVDRADLMPGTTLLVTVFVAVLMPIKDTDSRIAASRPRTASVPIAPHGWPGSPSQPGARMLPPRPPEVRSHPQPPAPSPPGTAPMLPHSWYPRP